MPVVGEHEPEFGEQSLWEASGSVNMRHDVLRKNLRRSSEQRQPYGMLEELRQFFENENDNQSLATTREASHIDSPEVIACLPVPPRPRRARTTL